MTGTVGWVARNKVAANLFMAMILAAGLVTIFGIPLDKINSNAPAIPSMIKQEIFPESSYRSPPYIQTKYLSAK